MRKLIIAIAAVAALTFGLASCSSGPSKSEKQRNAAIHQRTDAYGRSVDAHPVPKTENFPLRGALAESVARQDKVNHPWYIYILGDNGNAIGYYVGKTVPVNQCDFLSSTQDINTNYDSDMIVQAPSVEGVYYGESACDVWFFFDQATNAEIQIRGVNYFTSDQPLRIDAQPITVAPK